MTKLSPAVAFMDDVRRLLMGWIALRGKWTPYGCFSVNNFYPSASELTVTAKSWKSRDYSVRVYSNKIWIQFFGTKQINWYINLAYLFDWCSGTSCSIRFLQVTWSNPSASLLCFFPAKRRLQCKKRNIRAHEYSNSGPVAKTIRV
jgi:hypothetical protein